MKAIAIPLALTLAAVLPAAAADQPQQPQPTPQQQQQRQQQEQAAAPDCRPNDGRPECSPFVGREGEIGAARDSFSSEGSGYGPLGDRGRSGVDESNDVPGDDGKTK